MFEDLGGSCELAGREVELTALMASLSPGLPATAQQGVAEQLSDLVQSIASTPAAAAPDPNAVWAAQRQDQSFSLFGPDVLITATLDPTGVRGIHVTQEGGVDWQFDFAGALSGSASASEMPPQLRIRAYQDYQIVSDYQFESDGGVTDARDWQSRYREGSEEAEEVLSQLPTSEDLENDALPDSPRPTFADPPRAGGMPGLGLPSAGGLGVGPGLRGAIASVGRVAAGAAIGAAVGLAGAALRDRGVAKEAPRDATKEPMPSAPAGAPPSTTAPQDKDPSAPPYPGSTVEAPLQPPWRLRVLVGPEAGSIFPVKLRSNLGRADDNEIQILDPEISRNHLRFDVRDDAIVVTDLGSSRGTMVDGEKIDRPTPLRVGQIIEAGRSRFVLESTTAVARPSPAPSGELAKTIPGPTALPAPAAPPKAEPAIWHFAEKGRQQGPVTEAVLRERLAKDLPRETLVWNPKLDTWKPAHTLGLCPPPAPKVAMPPPSSPDQPSWYFMEKNTRRGPFTEAELRQRLGAGLSSETMVWHYTFDTWKPAHVAGLCAPSGAGGSGQAPARLSSQEAPIWYYMDKGARQGPVAESVLCLRLRKDLPPDTPVWHAKLDNWKPAHALGLCAPPAPGAAAPPSPAPEWYFMDHGVRQGPVAESVLRQRLAHGLPPDTPVWHAKLDNWKPAHSQGLCPSAAAPAVPGAATPAPPGDAARKCAKCGRALAPQHRFCAGCGTPVS